jgi:hypothetical protein
VRADSQQQGRFARWALFNATQNQHEPTENVKLMPNSIGFTRHESNHVLRQRRMMLINTTPMVVHRRKLGNPRSLDIEGGVDALFLAKYDRGNWRVKPAAGWSFQKQGKGLRDESIQDTITALRSIDAVDCITKR